MGGLVRSNNGDSDTSPQHVTVRSVQSADPTPRHTLSRLRVPTRHRTRARHVTTRHVTTYVQSPHTLRRTSTHHHTPHRTELQTVHVPRPSYLVSLVHLRLSPCAHHAPRLLHPLSPARGLSRLQPRASTYTTTRSGCEPRAAGSSTARRSRRSAWQRGWWGPVGCQRGVAGRV